MVASRPSRSAFASLLACAIVLPSSGCVDPDPNAWAMQATQLDLLRAAGYDGTNVRVAILDTGIDLGNPTFAHLDDGDPSNGELEAFADFFGSSRSDAFDAGGHGSYVAGILAGRPNQGLAASVTGRGGGVAGLAPAVDLVVGRVCDDTSCSPRAVALATAWAVRQEADIIALSLGFEPGDLDEEAQRRIEQALGQAELAGVLVVAAAGNGARVLYPARSESVLAVGAVDRDLQPRRAVDNRPGKPDVLAPGDGIVGASPGDGRVRMAGSSAAVPFVVAAAALAMQAEGKPTDAEDLQGLRDALRDTARAIADDSPGAGVLRAADAREAYGARDGVAPPGWNPPTRT